VSDELVTVANYLDTTSADIARNYLETEGVQAFVFNEAAATALSGIAAGGVKLQVPSSEAERARELLAEHAGNAISDEELAAMSEEQPLPGDPESGQELLDA
jgi:hypothetical protein